MVMDPFKLKNSLVKEKRRVEVSIQLGLIENEASKYFREFMGLKGQGE